MWGPIQSGELALRVVQCAGAAGWWGRGALGAGTIFLVFFFGPMRRRTFPASASWAVGGAPRERERVGGGLSALERNSVGTLLNFYTAMVYLEMEIDVFQDNTDCVPYFVGIENRKKGL